MLKTNETLTRNSVNPLTVSFILDVFKRCHFEIDSDFEIALMNENLIKNASKNDNHYTYSIDIIVKKGVRYV